MPTYNFDKLTERRGTDSDKWHKYGEDVLPMWVADMDFPSPEPVINALRERVEHGIFGYPMGNSISPKEVADLRRTIIDQIAETYDWEIRPEEIILLPGVVTSFNLACHALASPEEAVLVQTPVYPPILHAAKNTCIQGQEMELTRHLDGSYSVDWDKFLSSLTSETRVFLLCNPHNPVGKVFQQTELERMAEICLQNGMVICSDEIHCDLVFNGQRHIPIASIDPEIAQNTITLMAASKTYNLAGLVSSFAIIQNRDLRKQYLAAKGGLVPGVNLMGLKATQVAYSQGQEWLEQLLAYLQANRDYLHTYVQENLPGIQMGITEGTYLAWLDCRQAGIDGNPHNYFLEKARVALNDGETFGRGGEGFVRLNFGCPRATLTEALERMRIALGTKVARN